MNNFKNPLYIELIKIWGLRELLPAPEGDKVDLEGHPAADPPTPSCRLPLTPWLAQDAPRLASKAGCADFR